MCFLWSVFLVSLEATRYVSQSVSIASQLHKVENEPLQSRQAIRYPYAVAAERRTGEDRARKAARLSPLAAVATAIPLERDSFFFFSPDHFITFPVGSLNLRRRNIKNKG